MNACNYKLHLQKFCLKKSNNGVCLTDAVLACGDPDNRRSAVALNYELLCYVLDGFQTGSRALLDHVF
jgi:hypothetical protein